MPSLSQQAKDLKNLSFELKEFKGTVAKRNLQDSYRFAEIAEYEDYKLNVANTSRVMVTGTIYVSYLCLIEHIFKRREFITFRFEISKLSN